MRARVLMLLAIPVAGCARAGDAFSSIPAVAPAPVGEGLHRYWPRFPRPRELMMVPFVGDHQEGMVFETAAGLAADALRRGKGDLLLFEDVQGNSGYQAWTRAMLALVRPRVLGPLDTWGAVRELRKRGLIKGYLLYHYETGSRPWFAAGKIDESANVATSLAALVGGVAVSEGLEAKARACGLPRILDLRDKTEQWCLDHFGGDFSREVVMTAEPRSRVARSLGVALRAFVVSHPGPTYEAALARCRPDCPVLGWGCGGEDEETLPSTRWGLFQTATNWCHDLPAFGTEQVGETIPASAVRSPRSGVSFADLRWETGVHYTTFLMSDGDNVQWLMGNFVGGSEGHWYYESPARGNFPFGWTCCTVDLAQLCPYVLTDLFRRAAPTDDFVLYGGGYFYPDHFGEAREPGGTHGAAGSEPSDALTLHARRMAAYMRLMGLRSLAFNAMRWDSAPAQRAWGVFAANIPSLDGIFTVQYYPYSGGEGRILWAPGPRGDVPVVSCALCIWASTGRPRDTTPAGVARQLNAAPVGGPRWADQHFTYVMAHAWSRFRDTHGDPSVTAEEAGVNQDADAPGTARGLLPVQWCVSRLDRHVRVVTPTEFLLQVRLHLRTREALRGWLAELRPRVAAGRSARARDLLSQAEGLLPQVRDGDESGGACFNLLRRAAALLWPAPRPG